MSNNVAYIDGRKVVAGDILRIKLPIPDAAWDGKRIKVIYAGRYEMKGTMMDDGPSSYPTGSTVYFSIYKLQWFYGVRLENYLRSCVSV